MSAQQNGHAPALPQNKEAEEIAWAAGLFEGEGSFALRRNNTVVLSLAMTDLDVVERFRAIIGSGYLSSQAAGSNGRTKRLWRVSVTEVAEVLRIAAMLYPYLGERRRAKADEITAVLRTRIDVATAERACPNCRQSFRPPFTSSARATKFCSRLCERRYHNRPRWGRRTSPGQIGIDL